MTKPVRQRTVVRNKNLRHSVQTIRDWPDLDTLGSAGARMKLDLMLLRPEGATPEQLASLRDEDLLVLRKMAGEEDPAWGVTHQTAAIGALAERRDAESLLLFASQAGDRTADSRVRLAAIHAIGEVGGPAAGEVVRDLMEDKAPEIRAQAVRVLSKVGTIVDVTPLERLAAEGDPLVGPLAGRAAAVLRARMGLG